MENITPNQEQETTLISNLNEEGPYSKSSSGYVNIGIVAAAVIIVALVGYFLYGSQLQDSQPIVTSTPPPSATQLGTPTPTQEQVLVSPTPTSTELAIYENAHLGEFSFQYNSSIWSIHEKEFNEPESTIFPNCDEECLGIQLTSDDVSLELIFNISYEDNNGILCTNEPDSVTLDNGWFRVKDSQGYYYAYQSDGETPHGITLDMTPTGGDCLKYEWSNGTSNAHKGTEWTCIVGTQYKLCDGGIGPFVTHTSSVSYAVDPDGASIQLINPRLDEDLSEEVLEQVDELISTITF